MQAQKINWFNLSEYQKTTLLEQAKTHLQQQISEAKLIK